MARAICGPLVARCAADMAHARFDTIERTDDPMLLPGGLKYGGIYGFVPLCKTGSMLLCNARESGRVDLARATSHITIDREPRAPSALVDWIVSDKQ